MAETTTKTVASKATYTRTGEKVSSLAVGKMLGSDHGLYAQWRHPGSGSASGYEYDWEYATGERQARTKAQKKKGKPGSLKWFGGSHGTVDKASAQAGSGWFRHEWAAPEGAIAARCRIRPVSRTRDVVVSVTETYKDGKLVTSRNNYKSKPYFTAAWSGYKVHDFRADRLPTPTVTVEMGPNGTSATVTVTCDDADCEYCDIQASERAGKDKDDNWIYKVKEQAKDRRCAGTTTWRVTVPEGKRWWFRARVQTTKTGNAKGDSNWSSRVAALAKPPRPTGASAKASGDSGAAFSWGEAAGASSYDVQYVEGSKDYFDTNPEAVQTVTGITGTSFTPTGLAAGKWWFRVRAVNGTGESAWSKAAGTTLASTPDAPTTYETEPAFMQSDSARLRWTHNCADGSDQTAYQVALTAGGAEWQTLSGTTAADVTVALSTVADGTEVAWRVRTKGASSSWSPWSAWRAFSVYSQPSLSCVARQTSAEGPEVTDGSPLSAFPLSISLDASGGGGQVAGYHVAIVAASDLSYADDFGRERVMPAGEVAYSRDAATSDDPFELIVGSSDAILRDGGSYLVSATATLSSGLRADAEPWPFAVDFDSDVPAPTAIVVFDDETLTAEIAPECMAVDEGGDPTGEYAEVELDVYRIDPSGVLIPLATGIPNDGSVTVVDPHAPFGECWYHVVARDTSTGMTASADLGDESPHPTCVIQWDEEWQEGVGEDDLGDRPYAYSGARLDGLYNLRFDESGDVESEDVAYAGRRYPVSYYGTQLGYTARYQTEFPDDDAETLSLARRLLALRDDCFIREPSGTAFWAHAKASLSRSYDRPGWTLTVSATRVDRDDAALEYGEEG